MKRRLGQADLFLVNQPVGSMWVREISAAPAFQPRLVLSAGCQILDAASQPGNPPNIKGYQIAALGGQLCWGTSNGPVIGDLSFPRNLELLLSQPKPIEHPFEMSCDIPYHVLSRFERLRGAGPIVLWIDLSGWWAVNSQVYPMLPPPAWGIEVPAEMWDKFLDKSGYFNFNVITIRDAMAGGGHLAPAAAYLRDARELVSARPQAAVAKCRHVLEAVEAALEIEGRPPNWAPLLESLAGNQRAKGYCKIIHGLKKVSSATHHDTSDEKDVSRAEGKALVLICEALVELLGAEAEE